MSKTTLDEKEVVTKRKGVDPNPDSNPDPITGEPGSHPVGVAGGGAAGAAAGSAIGAAVGGPVGAAVGGVIGAVAGAAAGKGAAEALDPTVEDAYWRDNYKTRPYYKTGATYDTYRPGYQYGWEAATKPEYRGRSFDEVQDRLATEWPTYNSSSGNWTDVSGATRDAFDRASTRTREAGRHVENKADSVWTQVKGNFHQFKGLIKQKWNKLTDDEIDATEGHRERIIGKIQERYGEAKWSADDIEQELEKSYPTR